MVGEEDFQQQRQHRLTGPSRTSGGDRQMRTGDIVVSLTQRSEEDGHVLAEDSLDHGDLTHTQY